MSGLSIIVDPMAQRSSVEKALKINTLQGAQTGEE
jgi:hypothetical protein